MNNFIRNAAVFHIFAIIAMFSWICGGTRADLLVPVVPWFLLLLVTLFAGCGETRMSLSAPL